MSEALDAAVARHRAGDVEGARRLARAALDHSPNDSALLHFLGMVEQRAGQSATAQALFERAVAADPGYAPALVSLARLLAQAEDWPGLARLGQRAPPGALGDEFLGLRARALNQTGEH